MKKLALSLEDLRVTSFPVDSEPPHRGTVAGADQENLDPVNESYWAAYPCPGGDTAQANDCHTYVETCPMQVSCRDSCGCTGRATCTVCA